MIFVKRGRCDCSGAMHGRELIGPVCEPALRGSADEVYLMVFGQAYDKVMTARGIRFLTIVPAREAMRLREGCRIFSIGRCDAGRGGSRNISSSVCGVPDFDSRAGDGRILDGDLGRAA